MMGRTRLFSFLALASVGACAPAPVKEAPAELAPFAHAQLPDGVKNTTFIDFGSKITLVGYDVSPDDTARPGDQVKLTLYWKRAGQLDPGWGLFTHFEDDRGRQISNFDREGGFRGALGAQKEGLSVLELGKVYTDEQTLTVPKPEVATPNITIVVGVWNDTMRLPVISGPNDGHDAAMIAHLATGVSRRPLVKLAQGTKK
jgi:hypothetical protein